MKRTFLPTFALTFLTASLAFAQEVIAFYPGTPPGSTPENYPEKAYF